jgi:predicted permease
MGALVAISPSSLPRLARVELDAKVFAFTFGVTVLTGVLFGLLPAVQACRIDLHETLKDGAPGAGIGGHRGRARGALVVSEIALALVLLIGAGLLIDSFARIIKLDPGFDAHQTLTMKMSLGAKQDLTTESFVQMTDRIVQRLKGSPQIEAAATISTLPLEHGLMSLFGFEGRIDSEGTPEQGRAQWRLITPGFFDAMNIPLLKGRIYDESDTLDSEQVAIINNALAQRYFPDEDPIGQRLMTGSPNDENPYIRIVGVVGDVRELALDQPPAPTLYSPAAQADDGTTAFVARVLPTCLVVRAKGDPMSVNRFIQDEILEVDPEQPVSSVRTMDEVMAGSIAGRRFNTLLLAIFAGLALLLAVVGIYGVMAYSVAQRTREIGIRMALGAGRRATLGLIFRQGMILAGLGVVIGLFGAFALTRLMKAMLFEVSATDPKLFFLVAVALVGVAALACLIPALRATRVDPMEALRAD